MRKKRAKDKKTKCKGCNCTIESNYYPQPKLCHDCQDIPELLKKFEENNE